MPFSKQVQASGFSPSSLISGVVSDICGRCGFVSAVCDLCEEAVVLLQCMNGLRRSSAGRRTSRQRARGWERLENSRTHDEHSDTRQLLILNNFQL